MPLTRSARLLFIFTISLYVVLSLWKIHVSPFPTSGDACWYDMVARNLAQGRGLIEDCVWYFSIPFTSVSHPIGNLFNPLVPIILAGFYKAFGVSDFVGCLPVFIMDGILCAALFLFCWNRFQSLTIATFSSLIFTVHKFLFTLRGSGGIPESFLMFFLTLCCFALIWAWEGRRWHYLTAAALGGLAYLSRNEGGHALAVTALLFAYKEIWLPWRSGTKMCRSTFLIGLGIPLLFGLVVSPWEIRNHWLYGSYANAAKYNFFLSREYQDIWSYSQTFSLGQFIELGWLKIFSIFFTSYYYKLESFIEATSWPILLFLPIAWLRLRHVSWPVPILFYFLYSYIVMGVLNHVSQNSGWNGIFAFLPFWIPMALFGVRVYLDQLIPHSKWAARWCLIICGWIFLFHLADSVRTLHRLNKAGGDANMLMINAVEDWFVKTKTQPPTVAMTHFAYVYTYHTGIPSVKIPTNDPLEKIWEVADKYNCTHLILMGDNESVLSTIYHEGRGSPRLSLLATIPYRVTVGNGGDKIQIFRILPKSEALSHEQKS